MSRLICINSKGPMGSALLGGFIEKLGAVNVPLRQYGLSEYLLGMYDLDSGVMQERVAKWIERHSQPIRLGGVNVLDRDSQSPRPFSDLDRVRGRLDQIRQARYESIQDLHRACIEVFAASVSYKDADTSSDIFIDYPIDFGEFKDNSRDLYDAYVRAFGDVRMIHLHRDFPGWINAVAVQKFSKGDMSFRLKSWVKHYRNYEVAVSDLPGLHLDFQELFSTPIEALAHKIGSFAGLSYHGDDLRQEEFDLYGKFVPYERAFTPVDDRMVYLNEFTRRYFAKHADSPSSVGFKEKVVARILYFWCFMNFRARLAVGVGQGSRGSDRG